jgi:hypothetical protein
LAKKCPHCQHWQYKGSQIILHPAFSITLLMILWLGVYGFMGKMWQTSFSQGEPFSKYQTLLVIDEAKMAFGTNQCEHNSPTVAILGTIRNDSNISWKDIRLEGQFLDKDGKMIDTAQREHSVMVTASNKSAFKISFKREFEQEKYVNFKVRILSAKDERTRF